MKVDRTKWNFHKSKNSLFHKSHKIRSFHVSCPCPILPSHPFMSKKTHATKKTKVMELSETRLEGSQKRGETNFFRKGFFISFIYVN